MRSPGSPRRMYLSEPAPFVAVCLALQRACPKVSREPSGLVA